MWLFLASEAMLFASLFSAYVMLRAGALEWPKPVSAFPWLETLLLVGASAAFSRERIRLIAAHTFGLTFVVIKLAGDLALIDKGITPATSLMLGLLVRAHRRARRSRARAGRFSPAGWPGPSYRMSVENPRTLACAGSTPRVDTGCSSISIWLLIVVSFYVV